MRTDLREARNAKGLTQQELAEAIGKDQGAVSRYESGRPIDPATARKLADALGIPVLSVIYPPDELEPKRARAA